jgi:Peptidase family M23
MRAFRLLATITLCGVAAPALALELGLPIACEVGETCFVQNYVDRDPTSDARDYACGSETYDGHNGTDFRLPSMARQRAGVAVLAAADGVVLRTRDGMADVSVRTIGADQIKGRECGNGVIVQHADGFQSYYCHLARDSVRVKPGDAVNAGTPLGNVGLSGNTEYAHVHFTLRQGGKVVDPFAYGAGADACSGGASLWNKQLAAALAYRPIAVLNRGFAVQPVTGEAIEAGDIASPAAGADPPTLVAYVRAITLQAGDVQRLMLLDPDGKTLAAHAAEPLERNSAQSWQMIGRKRPPDGWKPGVYRATYRVERAGAVVMEQTFELRL